MNQHERDYQSEFALWLLGIALSVATITLIIGMVLQPASAAQRQTTIDVYYQSRGLPNENGETQHLRRAYSRCLSTSFALVGGQAALTSMCRSMVEAVVWRVRPPAPITVAFSISLAPTQVCQLSSAVDSAYVIECSDTVP